MLLHSYCTLVAAVTGLSSLQVEVAQRQHVKTIVAPHKQHQTVQTTLSTITAELITTKQREIAAAEKHHRKLQVNESGCDAEVGDRADVSSARCCTGCRTLFVSKAF